MIYFKNRMRLSYLMILFSLITLLTPVSRFSQGKPVDDRIAASDAGDCFIKQYRTRLDLGVVLDSLASNRFGLYVKDTGLLEDFMIDPRLLEHIDKKTAQQAYVSWANTYFLGLLYMYQFPESTSGVASVTIPEDITQLLRRARLRKVVINFGTHDENTNSEKTKYLITNVAELREFVDLNASLAELIKKHLPERPFETTTFKERMTAYGRYEKEVAVSQTTFAGRNEPLYVVHREFFTIYFVRDENEMKVLSLGIGH